MDFTLKIYNKNDLESIQETIFVYGIIRESEYLYIGKTTQGIKRVKSHKIIEDNSLIHIWFPNNPEALGILEARLIRLFKPKFNNERHKRELKSKNLV